MPTHLIGAANPRHGTVTRDLATTQIDALTLPFRSRPTAPETPPILARTTQRCGRAIRKNPPETRHTWTATSAKSLHIRRLCKMRRL